MAINPFTGLEEDDPAGFAGAPPMAMPAPPLPAAAPPLPGPNGTMAPGAVPEVAGAQQVLAQVDAVLGPGGAGGGGAGAPAQPNAPAPGAPPDPVQQAPLAGLMQGGTGQQRQAIQGQQVNLLEQSRGMDQQEQELARQAGDVNVAAKTTDAAQANLQAINAQGVEDEKSQQDNLFASRQSEAQQASERARQAWLDAKPSEWFQETDAKGKGLVDAKGQPIQDDSKMLLTSLGIALAHMADELNRGRGIKSNIGQQAMSYVDNQVERHRQREVQKIDGLHRKAIAAGQDEQRLGVQRAAAMARIEDKYAGINKRLEAEARAQRAQMGMDAARIESDQAVLLRARKTLEAEQRALNTLNGFVDRATALEIQQQRASRAGRGGGAGGAKPLTEYQQMMKDRWDAETVIPNLDGTDAGQAKTPAEAKKIREGQEAASSIIDVAERFKAFIDQEGTIQVPLFETTAIKRRDNMTGELAGFLTIARKTGVLNQGEWKRYQALLTPDKLQSNEGAKQVFDDLIARTREGYTRMIRSQGVVGEKPAGAAPTHPEALPATKPAGTAQWAPDDVQMLMYIQANPNWPGRAQAVDALKRKYGAGAASGL
jgi:hypothetical protein